MAEKILVVDDDADTLRLVGTMLERQGYTVIAAGSGVQALALAKSEQPDLVLLDLMMPDLDGIEVTRRLRADPDTQDVLVIMFTAKSQMDDKLEGFEVGADDYLTKPTQPRELVAHVKAVLKRGKRAKFVPPKPVGERGFVVGVLAAKGGIGVSTVAVNLGIAMQNQQRKDVVVADLRPGSGTIGLELGYSAVSQGFNRLLDLSAAEINSTAVDAELIAHASQVRFLLSSYNPEDAKFADAVEKYSSIVHHLAHLARYTVLDLGVGLTPLNVKILEQVDLVILVLEPVSQTITQTRALLEFLAEKGFGESRVLIALVNRVRAGMQLSLGQVQDQLGRNVSVIFTAAPELAYQAQLSTTPMILRQPEGITTQQFISLAEKVVRRGK